MLIETMEITPNNAMSTLTDFQDFVSERASLAFNTAQGHNITFIGYDTNKNKCIVAVVSKAFQEGPETLRNVIIDIADKFALNMCAIVMEAYYETCRFEDMPSKMEAMKSMNDDAVAEKTSLFLFIQKPGDKRVIRIPIQKTEKGRTTTDTREVESVFPEHFSIYDDRNLH